jgi:hypothetical protein
MDRIKPITDIRRIRLRELCDIEGGQANLARRVEKDRRQISAWLVASSKPGAKNMSAATARLIERHCMKPQGWLDHGANSSPPETTDRLKMRSAISLLRNLASLGLSPADLAGDPDAIAIAYNLVASINAGDT